MAGKHRRLRGVARRYSHIADPMERLEAMYEDAGRMRRQGERQLPGYVSRAGRPSPESGRDQGGYAVTDVDFGEVEPLRKRTEQEKLDSLTQRVSETIMALGGLPDSIRREIDGKIRLHGNLTGTDMREIARHYLEVARREWLEQQRRKVTSS